MGPSITRVPFSYLDRQFANYKDYFPDIEAVVRAGDFTLGKVVEEFEQEVVKVCQMPYAIGVSSGTDAIALSLQALGIGPGDEVITTPMTFIATVGAIVMTGAKPVFVDSTEGFVIDPSKIEAAITPRTKAILPVHYTGNFADMATIEGISKSRGIPIVEDACHVINGHLDGKRAGSWSAAACISLHPLKNINVWGDGGLIVTRHEAMAQKLRLLRNHGLENRDEVGIFGRNARLHSLQAAVGKRLLRDVDWITDMRIEYARRYDEAFKGMGDCIQIPKRRPGVKHVYHLYIIRVTRRDELLKFLIANGVEAKIHYPIPVHLQKAARSLGYKKGDFPYCEKECGEIISLPLHQHLTDDEIAYTIEKVRAFYKQ